MYEDYKQTVKRFYAEALMGELDVVDELCAENFREHEEIPGLPQDREGVKGFIRLMREAFPDLTAEIHNVVVENDTACVRATWRGTHKGEFIGIPATGKRFEVQVFDMVRFDKDGKAVEHWGLSDDLKMMQQLGVIPEEMG